MSSSRRRRVSEPGIAALNAARYQGLASFRLALRRFMAAAEAISKAEGVTQQQYQALLSIKTWPEAAMTVGDLAEQLLLTHHATVQLVDRMTRAGFAVRRPSPIDRRAVNLALTAQGEALVDKLAALHLREVLSQEAMLTRALRRLKQLSPDEASGR